MFQNLENKKPQVYYTANDRKCCSELNFILIDFADKTEIKN